jgi:hypothetical protein
VAGCSEHGKELSGSIKCGEFLRTVNFSKINPNIINID